MNFKELMHAVPDYNRGWQAGKRYKNVTLGSPMTPIIVVCDAYNTNKNQSVFDQLAVSGTAFFSQAVQIFAQVGEYYNGKSVFMMNNNTWTSLQKAFIKNVPSGSMPDKFTPLITAHLDDGVVFFYTDGAFAINAEDQSMVFTLINPDLIGLAYVGNIDSPAGDGSWHEF